MPPRRIYLDKTEGVFHVPTKNSIAKFNLAARDIIRIQFDKKETRFLGFMKRETETITIVSGKLKSPIVYAKNQNKQYFDEYKSELEKFTKDNNVTFTDNTRA